MRKHLYSHHLDAWVKACDDLKIKISAREAQQPVNVYQRKQGDRVNGLTEVQLVELPDFLREVFLDALVDFIVADDQVRMLISFLLDLILTIPQCSLSMLLSRSSFDGSFCSCVVSYAIKIFHTGQPYGTKSRSDGTNILMSLGTNLRFVVRVQRQVD
jgi:hypothetical protein